MPYARFRRPRAIGTAALCAWLCTAAVSCGRTDALNLADRFDASERQWETRRIDFGTAAARGHLGAGWGIDEKWGDASFVWALGEHSSVEFFVAAPRPLTLRMRCWPLPFAGLPTQTVRILLNDISIAELTLQPALVEYAVPVPTVALQPGVNHLEFRYGYARRPVDLDPAAPDPRPLAVAWDWLVFDGLADSDPPALQHEASGDALALPFGSAVSFHLDLPTGAALELDDVAPLAGRGATAAAALEVRAERDDGQPAQVISLPVAAGSGPQRWALDGSGVTRLTFRPLPIDGPGAGGLLLTAARVRVARPSGRAPDRDCDDGVTERVALPPVLVFLIDTLRADHVGCYGYPRATTPRIDAFARDAVRFAHGVAQSSWTKPSVASIFTGLPPPMHGANGWTDAMATAPTLASLLAAAGYDTMGFITNSSVASQFGLDQGFQGYDLLPEIVSARAGATNGELNHRDAEELRRAALAWLDARTSRRPLFLYLHASDPHDPYLPPEPFRQQIAPDADPQLGRSAVLRDILAGRREPSARERQALIGLYDAEVAFVDHEFGALLDDLRERGLYDQALIILVADHGEAFNDHGRWQHRTSLFDEQIGVPLLIKFPHQWRGGTVVSRIAQHIDILPTVLRYLDRTPPPGLLGRSVLADVACPGAAADAAPVYSYLGGGSSDLQIESIVVGDLKLIHNVQSDRPRTRFELYDLAGDPGETRDLAATRPVEVGYLYSRMAPFRHAPVAPAPIRPVDDALQERLRVLGYAR